MSVKTRWCQCLLLCFLSTLVLNYGAFGQAEIEKPRANSQSGGSFNIHVNVDLVITDVTVAGSALQEFQAGDFVIYDNNVSQNLTFFSHDQLPIAVALLIDSSGSVETHLKELQIAALTALRRLKTEDQVALYSFAYDYKRLSDLTADRLHIAKLISHLTAESGTDIFGTLQEATLYLKRAAPRHRRAIILISDNCHANGKAKPDKILTELLESTTTLYNIVTPGQHSDAPYCLITDPAIRKIATESGGEVMDVKSSMPLKGALGNAISRIRMQYTLGFNPSNPSPKGTYHKLKIRFADENRCPSCKIMGRSGYYSGVSAPMGLPETTQVIGRSSSPDSDQLLVQRIIIIAGTSSPDLNEIPFTITTTEQTDSHGRAALKLNLQIDPSGIEFPRSKELRTYKLITAILHADVKGDLKRWESWTFEDCLSEEEYDRILKKGIRLDTTIPLEPKNQVLKMVIYDENSGRITSAFVSGSSNRPHDSGAANEQ
jgi:VWFA-related protein